MFVLNSDHIGKINGQKKYNWPRPRCPQFSEYWNFREITGKNAHKYIRENF